MIESLIESLIGGLQFSTEEGAPRTIRTLDGWYSGPPVRSELEVRPNADGAFDVTRVFKGARVVTQAGLILASTSDQAIANHWIDFAALQGDGRPSEFTVTDASGTKSLTVTLAGPPEIGPLVNGAAEYVLQLIARDPVKYGQVQVVATGLPTAGGGLEYELGEPAGALYYGALGNLGRVTLTNAGTADTWPVFEISGTLDAGFYLQNLETGQILRYDRVVPAGTTLTIDSRTGEVLIDGVSDASSYLTRDEFFPIPAMGSQTVQFNSIGGSSGSPTLTASYRSGWW